MSLSNNSTLTADGGALITPIPALLRLLKLLNQLSVLPHTQLMLLRMHSVSKTIRKSYCYLCRRRGVTLRLICDALFWYKTCAQA